MPSTTSSDTFPFVEKLEITRWAEFALWLFVFFVGVPSNSLILCVCRARRLRTTTHVFIGALATADLLICLLKFVDAAVLASASHFLDYNDQSVVYFLSTALLYTTALLTTAIAFDRYDAVCRSFRRTMTLRRAKIVAGVCFATGFIGVVPEAAHKIHEDVYGHTVDKFIRSLFKFIPISLYLVSLCLVIMFYGIIFKFVRNRRQIMPSSVASRRETVCATDGRNRPLTGGSVSTQQAGEDIYTGSQSVALRPAVSGVLTYPAEPKLARLADLGEHLHCFKRTLDSSPPASLQQPPQACNAPADNEASSPVRMKISRSKINQRETEGTYAARSAATDLPESLPQQPLSVSGTEVVQQQMSPAGPSQQVDNPIQLQTALRPPQHGRRHQIAAHQSRTTRMLFVATFLYFVLWLPNVCIRIYALGSMFADFLKSSHHASMIAALVALRDIVYLNSVLNVFVYGKANRYFWDECTAILRKLRQRF